MALLIGFTGRLRSGKDTAYGFVAEGCRANGLVASRRGFADKLKVSAARSLGFSSLANVEACVAFCNKMKEDGVHVTLSVHHDIPETPGVHEPVTRVTGREYLQLYGTEAHREVFGEDFWVDALLPRERWEDNFLVENASYDPSADLIAGEAPLIRPDVCVVTDVRFDSEARRVRELGGRVARIERPSLGDNADAHASEAGVSEDLVTDVVLNDGDLPRFRDNVEAFLRRALLTDIGPIDA